MAKRFIDTSFYKSPFVRGLKGSLKSLYSFIICDCDGAGIWSADFEIAGTYIGFTITKKEFEIAFLETGKAIDLKNGRYFFPDFIEHQYPKGLSIHNPAQKNFINDLQKYSLIDEDLKVLRRPFEGSKVMVKEMVIVMEEEKGKGNGKPNKKEIPTESEFLDYYTSSLSKEFPNMEFSVKAKYESWVENGWKDGYNNPIKNWKSKLKNTITHLKQTPKSILTPKENTFENRAKSLEDGLRSADWNNENK